ncbi:hypothetical protein QAD02_013640 [Eretmocerus hayati]|uniref:Uncharacterized protein n=1 Tax=Eretmocerus hayati TaxID=131215 RepID=A0ACC2P430_9HYME|nr:hypothetical protein QAD02_013640 [Eretmocerus hayati]
MPGGRRPDTRSQSQRDQYLSLPSGGVPPATPPTRNSNFGLSRLPPAGFNQQPAWYDHTLNNYPPDCRNQNLDSFASSNRIQHSFEDTIKSSALELDKQENLSSSTVVEGLSR